MRLNTRTRYGTRAMLELARHHGGPPVSTSQVADSQGISVKYLESLFRDLRRAGLVRSLRGAQGGYALARPPEHISVRDIFEAFEGREGFSPCTDSPSECPRWAGCATRDVWARFYESGMQILGQTTLADLVREADARSPASMDYSI